MQTAQRNPQLDGQHRLLLVDDHAILREGLVELIQSQSDLVVCGESDDGPDAIEAVRQLHPDLVIVGLSLGGGSGLDLIQRLKSEDPRPAILVLSMHDEMLYAERSLSAGASGYVMKRERANTVLQAIRVVLQGGVFVSPSISQRLLRKASGRGQMRDTTGLGGLSNRELEVFRLLGEGQTTSQIAQQLQVSVSTVETHRAHLKCKLGLRNATELSRAAAVWGHAQ
jgi:DNA-binding NarL/FixJ family response regulator